MEGIWEDLNNLRVVSRRMLYLSVEEHNGTRFQAHFIDHHLPISAFEDGYHGRCAILRPLLDGDLKQALPYSRCRYLWLRATAANGLAADMASCSFRWQW